MLRRVRPSSLQIAEKCRRAPWLSLRHQEQNEVAEAGDTTDAYVSLALMGGAEPPPDATEAIAVLAWAREFFPKDTQFFVQKAVTLIDPRTGEELAKGKPDLLALYVVNGRRRLVVVDWKSIGQLYAGYLSPPDQALQQLCYLMAGALELGPDEGQVILVCFDEKRVKPILGSVIAADAWWPILDRIAAVPQVDPEAPEPLASKGKHCETCWQRTKCSAYLLPAFEVGQVPAALSPFTGPGRLLTHDDALSALEWLEDAKAIMSKAKEVVGLVQANLEAFANTHGPIQRDGEAWGPIETAGKRKGLSLDEVQALDKMGVGGIIASALEIPSIIRTGDPGVKYDWRKIPAGLAPRTPAPALAAAGGAEVDVSPPPPPPEKKPRKPRLKVVDSDGQPLLLPPDAPGEKGTP